MNAYRYCTDLLLIKTGGCSMGTNPQKKILEVESLYKEYGKRENKTKALNGLTCSVLEG